MKNLLRAGLQFHIPWLQRERSFSGSSNRHRHSPRIALFLLTAVSFSLTARADTLPFDNPPLRCAGYGTLNSIVLQDWEAGLGSWTFGTREILDPPNFDTPDWAVVGSLPASRPGMAAFVENIDSGNCADDDETGALMLDSPTINIPGGAQVPRISIEHWFDTEFFDGEAWDGGNLKISVNGGSFTLIPPAAIEYGSYNAILEPPMMFMDVWNTNPLAGELAFSGPETGQPGPVWGTTLVNLLGIAGAGDTVRLRLDFGIDGCGGNVGWYVDDVEFYHCAAELPPSNCGNGVIDSGEQCDDGNDFIDDGCSNTCQIELGWECEPPTSPGTIPDHSFEDGTPNGFWTEVSDNPIGTPICRESVCGNGGGTGPSDGTYWAWFGGVSGSATDGSLTQSITIPTQVSRLTFDLEAHRCDSPLDFVEVLIDGNQEWMFNGSSPLCGQSGYTRQTIDISGYADGGVHQLQFHGQTVAVPGGRSDMFIDNTALPGDPSFCNIIGTSLTLRKNVINDSGGDAYPTDWTLSASGPSPFSGLGPVVNSSPGFSPGTYNLSESGAPPGYVASAWDCQGGNQIDDDTVMIAAEDDVLCRITNDDVFPTITVFKTIINNSGGTITDPDAFNLMVDGNPVLHNVPHQVTIGAHIVSEAGNSGYLAGVWGGDCNPDGTISLTLGQHATCTITNDDIPATLTLVKSINNNNGGTVTDPNAFGLMIDGNPVLHNVANQVNAGPHTASETGLSGYQPSTWGGDCSPGGTINLALGQNATCTITNDDISPTLAVIKTIVNDHNGTETDPDAFGLMVDGNPVMHNVSNAFDAGPHIVSETGLPGYVPGLWGGACNSDGTITLALDQSAVCTITNNDEDPTTLILIKDVTNDNGGTATPSAWTLSASGPTGFSGPGPMVSSGEGFMPGTYDLSESGGPSGYSASTWVCVGGTQDDQDTVTLAPGEDATCTITNNDVASSLTLTKMVINDNGGGATPPLWMLTATGPAGFSGPGPSVSSGPEFLPGTYDLSESGGPAGYAQSAWVCVGGVQDDSDTITIDLGVSATCTITNDDISPTIKVVKTIVNDHGGSQGDPDAFGLMVDGNPVMHNQVNSFDAGPHAVSETGLPGYDPSPWGGDCDADGNITLALGQNATCTITNNDSDQTSLTLIKEVVNDDGGNALPSNWTLTATGQTSFGGQGPMISSPPNFFAGTYDLSESGGPAGYEASVWACVGGTQLDDDSIDLDPGESATCTIQNNDIPALLTVFKTILNDNGGTETDPDAFGLIVDGNPVSHNVANPIDPGFHTVSEVGLPGYAPGPWGGDCNADGTITLGLGENATCTITNDDIPDASLTLNKQVSNNNGGMAPPSAWTLTATGPSGFSGPGPSVSSTPGFMAGTYDLSESGGPSGYTASMWVCLGGTQDDGDTITLAPGEAASCTITNDDVSPTITVFKTIINDSGGMVTDENAFGLMVDGNPVMHNVPTPVNAGMRVLSETGLPGYVARPWGGDCAADGTINLVPGQNATCTLTNDDVLPTITVMKTVINDSGGMVTDPDAFSLMVDGNPVLHNDTNSFSVGMHTVSELGLTGYGASPWGGDCNGDGTIDLMFGQDAICTIVNDDIPPTLTVFKTIINDNGGTVTDENAFGLMIDALPVTHNVATEVDAGMHTVSETGLPGYDASLWSGDCNGDGTISLTLGQNATCTITNNDSEDTSLTLIKEVMNDSGGEAEASEWTLTAMGPTGFSGPGPSVSSAPSFDAGTYDLSETGPGGYSASAWVCVGGTQNDSDTVTVGLAQSVTCTITNNDISPTITVVKTIVNDNGGTEMDENAFGLRVDGNPVTHNATNDFDAGLHTVSEVGLPGYQGGDWGGDCNPDGSITLSLDQDAVCTITNDDISPTITVFKTIVNDDGGMETNENAFGLMVDDSPVSHNVSNEFNVGMHTVSETGLPGYQAGIWGGDCNPDGTVSLSLDQDATCTITNDDIPASITVFKNIINDNGGLVTDQNAFGLMVDGNPVSHNVAINIDAGMHTVSETGLAGYAAGQWGGDCNLDGTITLALGQNATCTITNDDISPTLTVFKNILNNDGGTVMDENAFGLMVDGNPVMHNVSAEFDAGQHMVSETGLPGYAAGPWGGDCNPDGSITLALGQNATCSVTNDDISPAITVFKTIINDSGGMVMDENAFGLMVDGNPVAHNVSNEFNVGMHTVSETGLPGYQPGLWGGDCNEDGTISLALGQDAICTITNNDVSPTITVFKNIMNDDGGSESDENAFGLMVDGSPVLHNIANEFDAGLHTVSETGLNGYQPGAWGGDCNADGTITLTLGQDATCTITNDDISPMITVFKNIINDNGGTEMDENAFGLMVDGNPVLHSIANEFDAGPHTVSETGLPGYQAGLWGGDCNDDGSITLSLGQDAVCTITNDDISPSITVFKEIVNDNGGTETNENAFGLMVDGSPVSHNVASDFDAGAHTVSETGLPGYDPGLWGGDCAEDGTITLTLGQQATCTITNDDISPTITVFKNIVNDSGGTETDENAFGLMVDGNPVLHNVANEFNVGLHTISEVGLPGYASGVWGGDCNPDGTITLAIGQAATCNITNDDISPTITVFKNIVNDNGGTEMDENAFGLMVDGTPVQHNVVTEVDAGLRMIGETGLSGYAAGDWGGDCNPDGSITLALDQDATCTITNDDISPTITVVKNIINDNGGTETDENAFGLRVNGNPVLHNVPNEFNAGSHTVSEIGLPGYIPEPWAGDCNPDGTITLELAQNAVCSIINNDSDQTSLTLMKLVENDNGGTASASAWTLVADGPTGFSGQGPSISSGNDFLPGTYDLSETGGPGGYAASAWNCAGGMQDDNDTITLELGESAICTITNDDISPTITVFKTIINDNVGTVTDENAFGLMVDGNPVLHNVSNEFNAGPHIVSEAGLPDYEPSAWGGDCNPDGTITLSLAQNATCTITNDDINQTSLTLNKVVITDNGGTDGPEDWILNASGPSGFSGPGPSVSSDPAFQPGTYNLSESGPTGYSASAWDCVGGTQLDDDTVSVAQDDTVVCTIINDDISPTLTVFKVIINDSGGNITDENTFGLQIDGNPVLHNVANDVDAGFHVVSESGHPDYTPGPWGGDCNPGGTITLALAQNATCTITNDDINLLDILLRSGFEGNDRKPGE